MNESEVIQAMSLNLVDAIDNMFESSGKHFAGL